MKPRRRLLYKICADRPLVKVPHKSKMVWVPGPYRYHKTVSSLRAARREALKARRLFSDVWVGCITRWTTKDITRRFT